MSAYRAGPCPRCRGSGRSLLLACGVRQDGSRFSETRATACPACRGAGAIDEVRARAMSQGEAMRRDRISRGLSQRQEAERLGIAPRALNDLELGR